MDALIAALRAAAEPTRLRLLAICAEGDVAVTELTQVLGQSQPRVSHHLKLLCDAGLLDRFKEGTWVFYRTADRPETSRGALARLLLDLVPPDDPQLAGDMKRLGEVKRSRADAAAAYFRSNAEQWDRIRSLHVDERDVEQALLDSLPAGSVRDLLDIGTGTGRILELFGNAVDHAVGIDLSRDMISVARVNLEAARLTNCQIRHADMYRMPAADESFDAVTIHQVLHYADRPAAVVAEAARVLRPGGTLVIADFAPHGLEYLRTEHAHRRLGFSDEEVAEWCRGGGLDLDSVRRLPGNPLTVNLWRATKPDDAAARPVSHDGATEDGAREDGEGVPL